MLSEPEEVIKELKAFLAKAVGSSTSRLTRKLVKLYVYDLWEDCD